MPDLRDELYTLWTHTTQAAPEIYDLLTDQPQHPLALSLIDEIWRWRTAGLPKKSAFDSRPISVVSCLARAWHKALFKGFPPQPDAQWSGTHKESVTTATAPRLINEADKALHEVLGAV